VAAKGAHLVTYPIANCASFNAVGIIQHGLQAKGGGPRRKWPKLALPFRLGTARCSAAFSQFD